MIYHGDKQIQKIYHGDKEIIRAYQGDSLVFRSKLIEGEDYEVCDVFKADIPNPTSNQNWLTIPFKEYAREVSLKLRLDYLGHSSFILWSNDNHTAWGSIYWTNSSVKFQRYNSANAKTEYVNAPINKGKWQDIIFKNRNYINVNGVDYQLPWYNITSLGGSTIADNGRGRTLIYFSDIKIGDKDVIQPIKLIRNIPNEFLSSGTLSNKAGACGLLYNGIFYGAKYSNHKFECYNN